MGDGARLDDAAVQRLFARAEAEVAEGRLPACQIAVACGDQIATSALGWASESSRFLVFSITKSLIAGATWLLLGDQRLSPAARVADVIPEFATNGKDTVTVEHLLTHTAGFPHAPLRPEEGATSAGRVERFEQWRLDWEPGTRTAYHPSSAHWVLAEIIERVAGVDYRSYVADAVLAPLHLDSLRLGVAESQQDGIVDVQIVGDPAAEQLQGADLGALRTEAAPQRLLHYNDPIVREIGVPGAGAVGSATDVARYFQALLHNPGGLWDAAVLREGTAVVHNALPDPITKVAANRTLGLALAGDDGNAWLREFGRNTGPRAFIASGIGGQVAWADPDSGLSFCFLTNGIDSDVVRSFLRSSELSSLAASCATPA
jgi:CubicO group peptidase (beta-lactamase class C family)